MNPDINISLIGMPAAGKSTIGVILAKTMGRPFLDTDILIQTSTGCVLPELISRLGMDAFLRLEEESVNSLQVRGYIIATGGSVIYGSGAMKKLKQEGVVIYLHLDSDVMETRIRDITSRGVVIRPGQNLSQLYAERVSLYEQYADYTVDTTRSHPEAVVNNILRFLQEFTLYS